MLNDRWTIILIICMSLTTIVLRLLPFIIFGGKRKVPDSIMYLGKYLPPAIIGLLIVYCFKDTKFEGSKFLTTPGMLNLFCVILVMIIQFFKKNILLSILIGTICYMFLVHIFII